MTQRAEGAAIAAGVARARLGLLDNVTARRPQQAVPVRVRRPDGPLRCKVVSRAELGDLPLWRSTFASSRKDHRYYEILEDTVRGRFDYRYFVITDSAGDALAIQPFFVMEQDLLEGVAALTPVLSCIRRLLPRFMTVRTLMVGCTAGEAHLAASPCIAAARL